MGVREKSAGLRDGRMALNFDAGTGACRMCRFR